MNDLIVTCLLLADRSRMQQLARSFRNHQQNDLHDLFVALGILVGAAIVLLLVLRLLDYRTQSRRRVNRPLGLFLALCQAHGLKWSDRWLLWRVARSQHLRDPGRLFLEPERLDPANLAPVLRLQWSQIKALRERLFGKLGRDEPVGSEEALSEPSYSPVPFALDQQASGVYEMPADQAWVLPTWSPATTTTEDTAMPSSFS